MKQNLYIIAGCNGAGKTTASFTILPEILDCREFVNADEIARGISPFQPETVAMEAGRIMLKRVDELMESKVVFSLETTLATKSYKSKIAKAKSLGYNVILLYFWLNDVELAKQRVRIRVTEGGHNIETDVIERRYKSGIRNLFDIYMDVVDQIMIVDSSENAYTLIAEGTSASALTVFDQDKFNILKSLK